MGRITQQQWELWRSIANNVLIWLLFQISEGYALRKKHDLWLYSYLILPLIGNHTSVAIHVADLHAPSVVPSLPLPVFLSTLCECIAINIDRTDIDMSVIDCVCVCFTHSSIRVCMSVHTHGEARTGCWVSLCFCLLLSQYVVFHQARSSSFWLYWTGSKLFSICLYPQCDAGLLLCTAIPGVLRDFQGSRLRCSFAEYIFLLSESSP